MTFYLDGERGFKWHHEPWDEKLCWMSYPDMITLSPLHKQWVWHVQGWDEHHYSSTGSSVWIVLSNKVIKWRFEHALCPYNFFKNAWLESCPLPWGCLDIIFINVISEAVAQLGKLYANAVDMTSSLSKQGLLLIGIFPQQSIIY